MSWVEVQKAINSDLSKPLNEQIQELFYVSEKVGVFALPETKITISRNLKLLAEAVTDDIGYFGLDLSPGEYTAEVEGDRAYTIQVYNQGKPLYVITDNIITLNEASWEQIDRIGRMGVASLLFEVGDIKNAEFDSPNNRDIQLAAFNHDILAYSGGLAKANYTFILKDTISNAVMNATAVNTTGWTNSSMRLGTMLSVYNSLPQELKSVIKEVDKKTSVGNNSSVITTTPDKLWLPSNIEVFNAASGGFNGEGEHYPVFPDANSRKKASNWWLRSPYANTTTFVYVYTSGSAIYSNANNSLGVVPGFCI